MCGLLDGPEARVWVGAAVEAAVNLPTHNSIGAGPNKRSPFNIVVVMAHQHLDISIHEPWLKVHKEVWYSFRRVVAMLGTARTFALAPRGEYHAFEKTEISDETKWNTLIFLQLILNVQVTVDCAASSQWILALSVACFFSPVYTDDARGSTR